MKNTQICPICGKEIDFVDDYAYFKNKETRADMIDYKFIDKNRIGMCKKCESPIYNTNRKIIPFQLRVFIIGAIIIGIISMYTKDVVFCYVSLAVYYIITQLWFNYNIFYSHKKKQHYVIPTKLKSVFCATFTLPKDTILETKNETPKCKDLFENNILEIKNGTDNCKVILIKKVDKNQYTFRFVEHEKDTLKDMLEKYDVFQLTNGVDILGSLEVTNKYPF